MSLTAFYENYFSKMAKNIAVHSTVVQHLMARSKRKTIGANGQDDDEGEASLMSPPGLFLLHIFRRMYYTVLSIVIKEYIFIVILKIIIFNNNNL